jgi:ribosomal protein S18 acetylase RimI-like enzyme
MAEDEESSTESEVEVRVRRIHRRDLNRTWEFLKLVFRDVNRETVEYQRPRSKHRFLDVYDDEDAEQLVFEVDGEIVGYAECTFEISGADNWLNQRYFDKRGMRPMFIEELAVHPRMQGRGVGAFMIEQLQHLARLRGCTHLVLEVAENNRDALAFYRHRNFYKLDAAIFMAQKIVSERELLPPRMLKPREAREPDGDDGERIEVLEVPEPDAGPPTGQFRAKAADSELARPKRKRKKKRAADE